MLAAYIVISVSRIHSDAKPPRQSPKLLEATRVLVFVSTVVLHFLGERRHRPIHDVFATQNSHPWPR